MIWLSYDLNYISINIGRYEFRIRRFFWPKIEIVKHL
jgi:hypothetical protein